MTNEHVLTDMDSYYIIYCYACTAKSTKHVLVYIILYSSVRI